MRGGSMFAPMRLHLLRGPVLGFRAVIEKRFGWAYALGAGVRVRITDDGLVQVAGAPGFEQAEVALRDVESVTVQAGRAGSGPANRRFTQIQLVGRGTVLGAADVNTVFGFGRSRAAVQAAAWLCQELARRRPTP